MSNIVILTSDSDFDSGGPYCKVLLILVMNGSSEGRFLFTFDFEVVSSKTIGFEVKGQRRIGLIQEQVDPGQLNAVPLKHRT